jgi:TonB family protein
MVQAEPFVPSVRFTRAETRRVTWALVISLCLHLLAWGGYELGRHYGWWELSRWPQWTQRIVRKIESTPPAAAPATPPEMTMSFVNVSQPSADAPKHARYYSDRNSRAANRQATREADQPDIQGHQTDAPMTEDVTRPNFNKLQPAPRPATKPEPDSPETPQKQAEEERKASGNTAGDLVLGKASPTQESNEAQAQAAQHRIRPRTLKEALARLARQVPSREVMMAGGVHRVAMTASFDAQATPFGEYDRALIDAVTGRWYNLLDSHQFAMDRTGKVTVHFRLNYDGTVTEVRIEGNSVGELLGQVCAEAVNQAAPFAPWPSDMRSMVGENYRDIAFTFLYY